MATFATISLYDALATPVLHAFLPVDHNNETWTWRDSASASVLGAPLLSLSRIKMKAGSGLDKSRVKVYVPVLETTTGATSSGYVAAPRLAYALNSVCDFIKPMRATVEQAMTCVLFMKAALAEAQITDLICSGIAPR